MSSSDRRRVLAGLVASVCGAAALGGCSLRPLYGGDEGAAIAAELASIEVKFGQDPIAQSLGDNVARALNPAGLDVPKRYDLLLETEISESGLAVQLDSTTTRYDRYLLASFSLRPRGARDPIYTSAARRVGSFDTTTQPYSTLIARRAADQRNAVELGQEIRTRLAIFFARRAAA